MPVLLLLSVHHRLSLLSVFFLCFCTVCFWLSLSKVNRTVAAMTTTLLAAGSLPGQFSGDEMTVTPGTQVNPGGWQTPEQSGNQSHPCSRRTVTRRNRSPQPAPRRWQVQRRRLCKPLHHEFCSGISLKSVMKSSNTPSSLSQETPLTTVNNLVGWPRGFHCENNMRLPEQVWVVFPIHSALERAC